ncbi:MAG: class I SAM-dependent methyltransferase [Desulfopila sp.]
MNSPNPSTTPVDSLDWNLAWQEARRRKKSASSRNNDYWNRRAPSFARHAGETSYSHNIIHLLAPKADWSILDVGCGAGTLALPLAHMVRQVTAIDFSEVMISILDEKCREQRLDNVTARVVGWEDDWDAAGIAMHDIAIASRSLVVEDLRLALLKLHNIARRRVVVSSLVGDGPFDRGIFEAIGRQLDRGPDYIYVYNLLNQMGLLAEVSFVANGDTRKIYSGLEDAVQGFHWMIDNMTPDEESLLRDYLARHLVKNGAGWSLTYHHPVRWAVISWWK